MNELTIITVNGEDRVDSRFIADQLGIEHRALVRTLNTHFDSIEKFGKVSFEMTPLSSGQTQKYYLLNENQCYFIGTLSRNTEKVVAFKAIIVAAFAKARQNPTPAALPTAKELAMLVLQESERADQAEQRAAIAEKTAQNNQVYRDYLFENILPSTSTHCITLIAKELGMSGIALNAKLREMGIQRKVQNTWVLNTPYDQRGYHKTVTDTIPDGKGGIATKMRMVWTERGRGFIHQVIGNINAPVQPEPAKQPAQKPVKGTIRRERRPSGITTARKEKEMKAYRELKKLVEKLKRAGFAYTYMVIRIEETRPGLGISYTAFNFAINGLGMINCPDILAALKVAMAREIKMISGN